MISKLFEKDLSLTHRIITSPIGHATKAYRAYFACEELEKNELDTPLTSTSFTHEGKSCMVVYFDRPGNRPTDWSNTQTAIIEERDFGGLYMAFAEITSNALESARRSADRNNAFHASAIIRPPSDIIQDILYPIHYRRFESDGFFALSRSATARQSFFNTINQWAGHIQFTRAEEMDHNNPKSIAGVRAAGNVDTMLRRIALRVHTEKTAINEASAHIRRIALHGPGGPG